MAYAEAADGWWREFVLAAPTRTAKLAAVRADGSPHVAPAWIDLGDEIVFMTAADTIKGKGHPAIRAVSLCWDDERPPFSFRTVAGTPWISQDPAAVLPWA